MMSCKPFASTNACGVCGSSEFDRFGDRVCGCATTAAANEGSDCGSSSSSSSSSGIGSSGSSSSGIGSSSCGGSSGGCDVCGCSSEFDLFGDRVCGCDACAGTGCTLAAPRDILSAAFALAKGRTRKVAPPRGGLGGRRNAEDAAKRMVAKFVPDPLYIRRASEEGSEGLVLDLWDAVQSTRCRELLGLRGDPIYDAVPEFVPEAFGRTGSADGRPDVMSYWARRAQ